MKPEKSLENILDGFWKWIQLLDDGNFEKAVEAIYWEDSRPISPENLKERITTFFEWDGKPMDIVYPCEELKEIVNNAVELEWEDYHQPTENHVGWCMVQVPVTNEKAEAKKSTNAGLWGVAASFFIIEINGKYAFDFEIFHL